jgi:hypothetical protein
MDRSRRGGLSDVPRCRWRRKAERRLAGARRRRRGQATVGGGGGAPPPPPPVRPPPAHPLLGGDGPDAAPLLLIVADGCAVATPASSSSPTSTAAADARAAAPRRHRSVTGRCANFSPELSKGWRWRLGFAAEGVRVRPVSAARAGTCTVLNGPSTGVREIFIRARPFTGSATSHTRPITHETAEIIRVPVCQSNTGSVRHALTLCSSWAFELSSVVATDK